MNWPGLGRVTIGQVSEINGKTNITSLAKFSKA